MNAKTSLALVLTMLWALGQMVFDVTPVRAAQYSGENGMIRFSFVEGDSLVSVLETGPPEDGVTKVDLWVWLTDVEPLACDKESFLAIGGFEFTLDIRGHEAFITKNESPGKHLNFGDTEAECRVGLDPGYTLVDGCALLAHYQIMFQGQPKNVVFGLLDKATDSCSKNESCIKYDAPAIYIGTEESGVKRNMFSAGYIPAVLNPDGNQDLSPVNCGHTWQDAGICEPQ